MERNYGRWLLAGWLAGLAPLAPAQSAREEVGLSALVERLGAGKQPTGEGVIVAQVEVGTPRRYAADGAHRELWGKRFVMTSGAAAPSAHATWVGLLLYGIESGIAPGVQRVAAYEVLDWLGAGFVNGSGDEPPSRIGVAVVNNSWIGDAGPESNAYLRKIDRAIVEQGITVLGGTANGRGPLGFPLLTHCFNGICVGRADGRHAAGETSLSVDGPGRQKPDLVGPAPASSFATPLVAGAAALLVETARTHPLLAGEPAAERPEVLKAVLMAGARHRSGWSNGAASAGPRRGATTTPLDPVFGADVVDVDHAHWILSAGRAGAGASAADAVDARSAGWSSLELGAGESRWWRFSVEAEKPYLSVLATWNRRVAADFQTYELPDLDLELYARGPRGEPLPLVGEGGLELFGQGNVLSESEVDNVEHLYVEALAPGEYLLELRRGHDELGAWTVALAWELGCPEPELFGATADAAAAGGARLAPRGVPAQLADAFALEVRGGAPFQLGCLLSSSDRAELPFAGGHLLLRPPIERSAPLRLDELGGARIPIPISSEMAGTRRVYQLLFADPARGDGRAVGLSNAVDVLFCR